MLNTLKLFVFAAFALIVIVYYTGTTLDDIRAYGKIGATTLALLTLAMALLFKNKSSAVLCTVLIVPVAYIGYYL